MRITGTKKLLIILFAVICAVAAGIGVLYAKPSSAFADAAVTSADAVGSAEGDCLLEDGSSDAASDVGNAAEGDSSLALRMTGAGEGYDAEEEQYDGKYDEVEMRALADKMGVKYEILNFYAHAMEASIDELATIFNEEGEDFTKLINQFIEGYAEGEVIYEGEEDIEGEDWFLSPDDASNYVGSYWICYSYQPGISVFQTSKPQSTETGLWGSPAYTLGRYSYYLGGMKNMPAGRNFHYFWVWLDPGESYSISINNAIYYASVTLGAERADSFIKEKILGSFYTQRSDGKWYSKYGDTNKTVDDYYSDITPTAEFLTSNKATGENARCTLNISGDAPSGVYYLQFNAGQGTGAPMISGMESIHWSTSSSWYNRCRYNAYNAGIDGDNYSTTWWYQVRVIVMRNSIEQPVMKFDDGVNSDRTKREVTYNGEAQTIAFEGDWGSGLSTTKAYEYSDPLTGGTGRYYRNTVANNVYTWYQLEETTNKEYKWSGTAWQEYNGSAWVNTTSTLINTAAPPIPNRALNITLTGRPARGSGTKGDMTYAATECGKYKILVSPFKEWTDGTSSTLAYDFIINKIKLQRPSLVKEDGVTDNLKFVNDNEGPQFISINPVLSKFMNINMGGLAQYAWSSDGLITLTGNQQGDYDIEVSLKNTNNTNIEWATPSDSGDVTDTMKFRLTIGPMKITTPYVVEGKGVTGNVKEITYSGGDEYMSFMFVRTDRMTVNCGDLNGTVADNRLSVPAKESGTYKIYITPLERYCWQDGSSATLEFTFIINPMKISAPIFDEPTADGRKKTVVYYGEKDENGYDWFETLTFQNAYQARVKWNTAGNIGQYTWGDSELKLSATSAGTSTVYFTCLPNYQWDDTVETDPANPERTVSYTLEIKRKPLDLPQLIKDSEDTAGISASLVFPTDYRKEVPFDFKAHNIYIKIGEADSIFVTQGSALTHEWGVNGDPYLVKFTATEAGNHSIRLRPTGNYCWNDATQSIDFIDYVFRIAPISLPALGMEIEQTVGGTSQWITVPDYKTGAQLNYTGQPQRARIGKLVAAGEELNSQLSYDPEWHHYMIVDSANNPILAKDYGEYGITVTEGNGVLNFSAVRANIISEST